MTTSTHSHKAWTDEGGHVKIHCGITALSVADTLVAIGGSLSERAKYCSSRASARS